MADNSRVTPEDFNSNSRLRASDADRDRAASVLNEAMAQGRLTAAEHSDRLDAIYAAKTHADLVPVIDDLPAMSAAVAPATGQGVVRPAATGRRLVAVFGGSPERACSAASRSSASRATAGSGGYATRRPACDSRRRTGSASAAARSSTAFSVCALTTASQ